MAALVETYSYDWMRAIPGGYGTAKITNQGILWNLVHALTGDLQVRDGGNESFRPAGAWTVESCSDGTAYGVGDNNNRWWNGGTFDAAKMPWNNSGNIGWIVLKSPAGLAPQTWLCFGLDIGTTGVRLSSLASFTAFDVGGSLTAHPTSATQFAMSNGAGFGNDWGLCTTAADHKTSLSLASDGAFFWGANKTGGTFRAALAVVKLLDAPAVDLYPVATFRCNHTDDMQVGSHQSFPATSSGSYSPQGPGLSAWSAVFTEQDSGSGTSDYGGSPWATRNKDNTSTVYMRPIYPMLRYWSSLWGFNAGDVVGTVGYILFQKDQITQTYPEWQVWLVAVAAGAGNYGIKGRVRDMHTAFGVAELTAEPSGADPITRVVWGDSTMGFWLPGDQVMSF